MIRIRTLTTAALTLGATLVVTGSAAAQKVSTNYDQTVDFTAFKTYNWVDIQGASYPSSLVDAQIRAAVDSTLKAKGMTKVDSGGQVYVAYQVTTQQQKQLNTFGTGGGGFGGGWGWGGGMSTTTTSTITDGTLAIDIYDPVKKQIIWQGTATKQLNPSSDAAKNQQNLQKAINKLLGSYPPGAQKKS